MKSTFGNLSWQTVRKWGGIVPFPTQTEEETFYEEVKPEQMILRDHLALDRTELANERTLLAYVRTAMALFLTGFSAMHLPSFSPNLTFEDLVYQTLGWALVAAALFVMGAGWVRYRRVKARITPAEKD